METPFLQEVHGNQLLGVVHHIWICRHRQRSNLLASVVQGKRRQTFSRQASYGLKLITPMVDCASDPCRKEFKIDSGRAEPVSSWAVSCTSESALRGVTVLQRLSVETVDCGIQYVLCLWVGCQC